MRYSKSLQAATECRMKLRSVRALAAVFAMFVALPVTAAEHSFPRIEGAIPIEVQNDWDYDSDDPGNERNNLFTLTEPEATIHIAPGLSVFFHAVLEQVTEPDSGEDRVFEDQGLFLEDLYLAYERDWFRLKGGKFTPNFGIAWEEAPGVYGTDFAEAGYEIAERIGVGMSVSYEHERFGAHRLSASTFFLDTSVLAQSTLKGRGTTGLADGGVSNTENFSSFAIALDGGNIAPLAGFRYHLAYIQQRRGRGNDADETGFAIAATHVVKVGVGFELHPLIEYVRFDDADGTEGQDREFLTIAGKLTWRRWNMAVSYTGRDTDSADGTSVDDESLQISAGYAFESGLTVDLGWRHLEESRIETMGVGALVAYAVEF